jgi:hypothetical protein
VSSIKNVHTELTTAGWSYRMNDLGWVIYRHPHTGSWHTRPEAEEIAAAEAVPVLAPRIRSRSTPCPQTCLNSGPLGAQFGKLKWEHGT